MTSFSSSGVDSTDTILEVVDPQGGRERWENQMLTSSISYSDPVSVVPVGMLLSNTNLTSRNTFYWNKEAMSQDPNHADTSAHTYHWLSGSGNRATIRVDAVRLLKRRL